MKLLLLALLLIAALIASAQRPPVATAQFCGNEVITGEHINALFEQMRYEGCNDFHFIHVGDGYYLGYGTMVVHGER